MNIRRIINLSSHKDKRKINTGERNEDLRDHTLKKTDQKSANFSAHSESITPEQNDKMKSDESFLYQRFGPTSEELTTDKQSKSPFVIQNLKMPD